MSNEVAPFRSLFETLPTWSKAGDNRIRIYNSQTGMGEQFKKFQNYFLWSF